MAKIKSIIKINEEIQKLEKEKAEAIKKQEEEENMKRQKDEEEKKSKGKDLFKGKTEKDFYLLDPANVMAVGKIQNFEDSDKPLHLLIDFERENKDIKVISDLKNEQTFEVWKDNKKWGRYSMEYYKRALEVAKAWRTEHLDFYITSKKDSPLLMACEDLGFVLAPRIESEDE